MDDLKAKELLGKIAAQGDPDTKALSDDIWAMTGEFENRADRYSKAMAAVVDAVGRGERNPGRLRIIGTEAARQGAQPKLTERDKAISDLMKTYGVDRQKATELHDRIVEVTPDTVYGGFNTRNRLTGTTTYTPSTAIPNTTTVAGTPAPEAAPSAMNPNVDYTQGTGTSGFLGVPYNMITDFFAGKLGAPETEKAVQGLINLGVRTRTLLQDAIPGRPSNYLMEQLDKLTVTPGSPFQGDARSLERLTQTRDMIRAEIQRMDRDVLGKPGTFSRKDIADTESSKSNLEAMLRDYDIVVSSFEKSGGQGGGGVPRIANDDEYNRLPSGTTFIGPDNQQRRKP